MRFGIFIAPFHPVGQNPTLALERDLELIVRLDQLGYDEAWVGEHHSAGYEIIASPEVFIAVAAERTRHIRLGTGVNSLPLPPPADPGRPHRAARPPDEGTGHVRRRPGRPAVRRLHAGHRPAPASGDMMEEGARGHPRPCFDGDEPVTRETDWFTLRDARLQLRPYTPGGIEVGGGRPDLARRAPGWPAASACACCRSARPTAGGFDVLGSTGPSWRNGPPSSARRSTAVRWRLVGPMHLAETEAQARKRRRLGLAEWVDYFQRGRRPAGRARAARGRRPGRRHRTPRGMAVIGTPDMAIAQIERLQEQSGGFGTYLFMAPRVGRPGGDAASPTSCSPST